MENVILVLSLISLFFLSSIILCFVVHALAYNVAKGWYKGKNEMLQEALNPTTK